MSVTRTSEVTVQCVACGFEFETHPANLGYGNVFCDECEHANELADEYMRAGH